MDRTKLKALLSKLDPLSSEKIVEMIQLGITKLKRLESSDCDSDPDYEAMVQKLENEVRQKISVRVVKSFIMFLCL